MKPTTGVLLLLVTISCFCVLTPTMAANFIVTSNADSGPGTLRDAITKANSNGTAAKDYIYFNLPGTQPGDVTITLLSDLPGLTSNIAVDASTQAAPLLGASGARVFLYRQLTGSPATYYALLIDDAQQVEIYGLAIKNTLRTNAEGYGILLSGTCSDITIGGPGKGNVINGYKYCIYGDSGNFDPKAISNLVIQSNIIGFEEDGMTATAQLSSYQPILLAHLNGVTLGGNRADLGNVIMGNTYGVSLRTETGNVVASFNKIGTDVNGTSVMNFSIREAMLGIYGTTTGTVQISDNQIAGVSMQGIGIVGLQNATFRIVRNKIGTEVTGQNVLGQRSSGVLITDCNQGMIGGSLADKNIIAGCYDAPVTVINAYRVTVSQNEMFCNNVTGFDRYPANSIQLENWSPTDGRPMPFVHVTACTATTLSGTATPNAKMEVFIPYRCSGSLKCDGRNYIETFFAGADGKWTYALKGRDGVILSATDASGATSDYSNPVWSDHIELERGITHTACGKSSGSIPNKLLYNATPFHWEDDAGNTVGTDTSLNNVPAGRYRLVMYGGGCNKPECIVYSPFFEVKDETPQVKTTTAIISPATCGANNGSIYGLQFQGINLKYAWSNTANVIVGTGPFISNLAPGSYTLTITDTVNGCTATGGPFVINGVTAPVLDVSGAVVKDAICSQPNGSITGLNVTGTGVITYTWKDASGQVVGNAPDLLNVPAGVYTLSFTDASTCPALPSAPFTITAPGVITINQSGVAIKEASCAADDGGVTGLQATNAETVRWVDQNGATVGTSLDLTNMPAGIYTLQISNTTGCDATATFTVPKHKPVPMNVAQINTQNPVCNLQNGSVTGLVVVGGTPASYKWFDQSGTLITQNKDLTNVGDGTYRLYITDIEQCEQLVTTVNLRTPDLPFIDDKSAYVIDDVCNTTSGMITGISVAGKLPLSYVWLNEDSTVVSTFLKADGLPGGDYTLQVTDGNGCIVYSRPYPVLPVDILLLAPAAKDVTIIKGMTAEINVSDKRIGIYTLFKPGTEWSEVNDSGLFRLTGITETTTFGMNYQFGDCVSPTTTFRVYVIDAVKVVAPTAFSPNGDGHNDIFKPKGYGVASYNVFSVMDRWGNVVFSTKSIEAGWDGTFRGKKVEAGAYVWMIQGIDILGHPVQDKGAVLVVY